MSDPESVQPEKGSRFGWGGRSRGPANGESEPATEKGDEVEPGPSGPAAGAATSLRGDVARAGQRIQEIIDIAQRFAEETRLEAERSAAQYLDRLRREADQVAAERTRQLAALERSMIARAERLRAELAEMIAELDRTIESVGSGAGSPGEVGGAREPRFDAPRAAAARSEPVADPGVSGPAARRQRYEGEALLRAVQLAVMGKERAEIEETLTDEFGFTDPAPLVDEVLGP
jgi:hypothetical protein